MFHMYQFISEYGDHVKPARRIRAVAVTQTIVGCSPADRLLFSFSDSLERIAACCSSPVFYLRKYQRIPVLCYDVDFTAPASEIVL